MLPDGWFASLSFCRCSNRADESPATGHIAVTAPLTAAAVVVVIVVVVVVVVVFVVVIVVVVFVVAQR